jgi:heme exporter protein C
MSLQINNAVGWIMVIITLAFVGYWVPHEEKVLGSSYLIFFFHFPSAINCMNLFVIGGVCSFIYLLNRNPSMDLWATSAVEVGMLACTITLVTGGIWARAAWGEWDTWIINDPRLMSVYFMWLTYAAYLALRTSMDQGKRRELYCAVFGLLATVNVPIVYYAIRIFGQENHPMSLTLEQPASVIIDIPILGTTGFSSMKTTMRFGALAFLVLYIGFVRLRRRHYHQCLQVDKLQEKFNRAQI